MGLPFLATPRLEQDTDFDIKSSQQRGNAIGAGVGRGNGLAGPSSISKVSSAGTDMQPIVALLSMRRVSARSRAFKMSHVACPTHVVMRRRLFASTCNSNTPTEDGPYRPSRVRYTDFFVPPSPCI